MKNQEKTKAEVRPAEFGDLEISELRKAMKLGGIVDFVIHSGFLTTYKPVALGAGYFWRDQKFHFALGELSKASVAAGGGAKSAVITRASNAGQPTIPGEQFWTMLEEARDIKIKRGTDGSYDYETKMQLWYDELELLGLDLVKLGLKEGVEEQDASNAENQALETDDSIALQTLFRACGILGVAPKQVFPSIGDFKVYILERWPAKLENSKIQQLNLLGEAVRHARRQRVPTVTEILKQARSLS
jgi:hypothetical protein